MPGPAVPEYSSAFQSDSSTPAHAFRPIPYIGIRVNAIEEANQSHEHAFPPIPYTEIRSEQHCYSLTLKLIMCLKHITRIPVGPSAKRSAYHHFAATADYDFYQPRSGMCCHPERSEGSLSMGKELLRCAQHDRTDFGR